LPNGSSVVQLSLPSNDIAQRILSIVDVLQRGQQFGQDENISPLRLCPMDTRRVSISLSPVELEQYLYSPADGTPVRLEDLLIESDEISRRAFRRYRCKHMSLKSDERNQVNCEHGTSLAFDRNVEPADAHSQILMDADDGRVSTGQRCSSSPTLSTSSSSRLQVASTPKIS
jgi:hypothetical protein